MPPFYYWTDDQVEYNFRHGHHIPRVPYSLKTSDVQLARMRKKWWAMFQTCCAANPMDRPVVEDMKLMLYFPASIDDHRNEAHGYTLGTDVDGSKEFCKDNACVHFSLFAMSSSSKVQTHNSLLAASTRIRLYRPYNNVSISM